MATASIISRLNIVAILNQQPKSHTIVAQLIGLTRGDLKTPIEADLLFIRLSFVALFQFQLETLLKIILTKINPDPPPKNYYDITNKILSSLAIKHSKRKHNILICLAFMRNCLHSNGIHTNATKRITIKGHKIKFVKGRSYEGGNLDEIHFVANEVLTILEEILDHSDVQAINMPLPNQFFPNL